MAPLAEPQARLAVLPRVDGSATYSYGGYTITASANGPIEAPRRDEDPDEAAVDVIVRPAAGAGGPSERHLESVLQKTLQDLILVHEFPRFLVQVVLQVQAVPENDYVHTRLALPGLNLGALPALLQTAVLALLSASIPLRTTATAASVACLPDGRLVHSFSPRDAAAARSTHVFAFALEADTDNAADDADDNGPARLLLAESEGAFTMDEWDRALAAARRICCGRAPRPDDDGGGGVSGSGMVLDSNKDATGNDDDNGPDMRAFLQSTVQGRLENVLQWKTAAAAAATA